MVKPTTASGARRDLEIRGPGRRFWALTVGPPLLPLPIWKHQTANLGDAQLASVMLDRYAEMARRHVLRWLEG
jgi:ATP-dependent DNA helicase RecG